MSTGKKSTATQERVTEASSRKMAASGSKPDSKLSAVKDTFSSYVKNACSLPDLLSP